MQLAQIDPTEENQPIQSQSWLDHPVISGQALNWEKLIFALIVILAIVTRFYMLEPRVMSHDETTISLCMDNNLPIVVFNLNKPGNLLRLIRGQRVGTLVHAG